MAQQFGIIQTLYESREKKGINVQFNPDAAAEIETYMTGLEEMLQTYKDNEEIVRGLNEVKAKANSFLISHMPEEEIIAEIRKITTITGPGGKKMNISNFSKAKSEQIKDVNAFKQRTLRRLNQTIQNSTALLQWKQDTKLAEFVTELKALDQNQTGHQLDRAVREIVKAGGFSVYQKIKDEYLREWLKPFQEELGKPIESLTPEEMQEAMKRMKIVMKQRLNEGNLVVYPEADSLKDFNLKDHDMVTGHCKDFWLNDPLMDEFVNFTQAVLNRFTFMLDKQFLVFQFRNEPYLYLIGFSHESFLNAEQSEDGSLLISPHVKPIVQGKDGTYRVLSKSNFPSVGMYIDVVKDTLKPFFVALAEKVGFELSKEFKQHFKIF